MIWTIPSGVWEEAASRGVCSGDGVDGGGEGADLGV